MAEGTLNKWSDLQLVVCSADPSVGQEESEDERGRSEDGVGFRIRK